MVNATNSNGNGVSHNALRTACFCLTWNGSLRALSCYSGGFTDSTQGGNAIDAAIAANVTMTVVYPSTCSAGGDVFMLIWNEHERKLYALNGSGRAPQRMTPELFAAQGYKQIPERGPLTINVPGAVDGWFQALREIWNTSCRNNICIQRLRMLKKVCRLRTN